MANSIAHVTEAAVVALSLSLQGCGNPRLDARYNPEQEHPCGRGCRRLGSDMSQWELHLKIPLNMPKLQCVNPSIYLSISLADA